MASSELAFLMEDVSKELAAVYDSLKRKYVEFVPVIKTERHKIINTLNEMKDSLGSRLDVIEADLDAEEARLAMEEVARLRGESARLRECRELLDKLSTLESALEEMHVQFDTNAKQCSETIRFAISVLPKLEELISLKTSHTEATLSITMILHSTVAALSHQLIGKLNAWFKQTIMFPQSRIPSIMQMNVCVPSTVEASNNISAMSNLDVLGDWLSKIVENIMKTLVEPITSSGGAAVVHTTVDPVNSSLYIFRVRANKTKRRKEDAMNAEEIFKQLKSIFAHLNKSLLEVDANTNTLAAILMKTMMPQLQMAILKNVISAQSISDTELAKVVQMAEKFRDDLIEMGLINAATPTFEKFAASYGKVFTDRKCVTRLARARELILMPYIELVTVGYGEEAAEEGTLDDEIRGAIGISLKEAAENDKTYPYFFRLLRCQISRSIKDLMALVRDTVEEAAKCETEEIAGRLMLTARNMVEMFLLLTECHAVALSSVPQMAAIYHNNCHYIGHRLMLMVFDINDANTVVLNAFRAFFATFLLQLRASAQEVMSKQLVQIRRNLSSLLADATMARVESLETTADQCVKLMTSVSAVWKEVLPELVYCGAMSSVIGFFFDRLSALIQTAEDITEKDALFIAKELSVTLRLVDKLMVIRGTPHLHKECSKPYFHFKETIFMLNASLQDIDDRWCSGVGPLAEYMSVKEVRHLVRALFSNSDQRSRLLNAIY